MDLHIQTPEPLSLHYCAICAQLVRPRMLQLDRLEAVEYKGQYYHLTCVEGSRQPIDPGLHEHIRRLKNTLTGMPELPQPKKGSGRSSAAKASGQGTPLTAKELGDSTPRNRARKTSAGHRVVGVGAGGARRATPVGLYVFLGGVGVALLLIAVYFAARAGVQEAAPSSTGRDASPPTSPVASHPSLEPTGPVPANPVVPGSAPLETRAPGQVPVSEPPPPVVGRAPTGEEQKAAVRAAETGDLASLQRMVAAIPRITEAVDSYNYTLLHRAARFNRVEILRYLLSIGMPVDLARRAQRTALEQAAEFGALEAVKFLLDQGAKVNAPDAENSPPLYWCLMSPETHIEVVRELLRRGGDPNQRNTDTGETPMHVAVRKGNLEIVDLMVRSGGKLDVKDGKGRTPLDLAQQADRQDLVKILSSPSAPGATAKVNPAAVLDPAQAAAMIAACKSGDLEKVQAALRKNCDLACAKDEADSQPIHFAAERGDLAIAQALLAVGVDVNVHHRFGRTPLHRAVEAGKLEMVKWLLDHGADINGVSNSNKTALYYAAELGGQPVHAEIVKLLLERHADATLRDTDDKKTAYEVAKANHREALVKAFEQAGVTR